MLLVQVGGLGIMTLAAFFTMLSGRGMNLREKIILRDQINANEVISIL